jgi:DNA-binding transcriptional MerR regulator
MTTLYTPKQAQEMLGVSATGLRIYTTNYPRHLSTEATGKRRKFTEADLCFLAYIKQRTDAGDNHRALLEELETDEGKARWHAFESAWQPLSPPDEEEEEERSTAMVPVAQLQAARLLFEDAQRREQEALELAAAQRQEALQRERELLDQLHRLQREMGKAEGKIESLEAQLKQPAQRPRSWWARMFGGE